MKKKDVMIPRESVGARWISFRLPDGMRRDLQRIAGKETRSLSSIIRIALSGFIVNYDASRRTKA